MTVSVARVLVGLRKAGDAIVRGFRRKNEQEKSWRLNGGIVGDY